MKMRIGLSARGEGPFAVALAQLVFRIFAQAGILLLA
jgi:hypothetical protein